MPDGVLIPFIVNEKDTHHLITSNAFGELKRHYDAKGYDYDARYLNFSLHELLPLAPEAYRSWSRNVELWVHVQLLAFTAACSREILARKWSDVQLEATPPHIYVERDKSGREEILYLLSTAVDVPKQLPSYGKGEYLFPARGNVRHAKPECPHRWSFGKQFRRAAERAGLRKKRGAAEEQL